MCLGLVLEESGVTIASDKYNTRALPVGSENGERSQDLFEKHTGEWKITLSICPQRVKAYWLHFPQVEEEKVMKKLEGSGKRLRGWGMERSEGVYMRVKNSESSKWY